MNPSTKRHEPNLTRAIVRPPAPNFADGLTTVDLGEPDYQKALAQHAAYCQTLERCGLTITSLPPDPDHPDSTFVEDTAIIVPSAGGPQIILTRPGAASRSGEVASVRTAVSPIFDSLLAIESPGTVDGGDICEAGDHFFIGISQRTNRAGGEQLSGLLQSLGYSASLVDIRAIDNILHLKSGIAYLGDKRLITIDSLAGNESFRDYELVSVSAGEEYAANCIRVNSHVLIATGSPRLHKSLTELGYETIALEMSEYQKMDGGLSCLSLRW